MISFILFYLIGIPVSVLLHELGHALCVVMFSKEEAYVYLGTTNESNKENFRIGRVTFHITFAYSGFCAVKNMTNFSIVQSILFFIGGPIVSVLLFIGAYFISAEVTHYGTRNFLNGIIYINLFLFILTIIPIRYPKVLKTYAGFQSDGYQILTLLKGRIN
ncbi:hypothetical protein [Psychrobacillus sp. L3]|uniref:hypothetical protein n=1 Tax=Psychrobacillus sp. L3 TaxID=3236891 RepID=UPI0036F38217